VRYEPAAAGAAPAAAGTPLVPGGAGRRRAAAARPLELRLLTRSASDESRAAARLIAGWLGEVGVAVAVEELDDADLAARVWRVVDGEPSPDYDLLLWGWRGDVDPQFVLSVLSSTAIGTWNQAGWSSPEYDDLFRRQARTVEPLVRRDLVWRMQDLVASEAPLVPLVYGRALQVYDARHWRGWVRSPAGEGGVIGTFQIASYLRLRPEDPWTLWGLPLWAWTAAAAVAAAAAVLVLLLRRR
jgi:peptide/nickel transport system substrate-binding protein